MREALPRDYLVDGLGRVDEAGERAPLSAQRHVAAPPAGAVNLAAPDEPAAGRRDEPFRLTPDGRVGAAEERQAQLSRSREIVGGAEVDPHLLLAHDGGLGRRAVGARRRQRLLRAHGVEEPSGLLWRLRSGVGRVWGEGQREGRGEDEQQEGKSLHKTPLGRRGAWSPLESAQARRGRGPQRRVGFYQGPAASGKAAGPFFRIRSGALYWRKLKNALWSVLSLVRTTSSRQVPPHSLLVFQG